jgi:hypothetical protein
MRTPDKNFASFYEQACEELVAEKGEMSLSEFFVLIREKIKGYNGKVFDEK